MNFENWHIQNEMPEIRRQFIANGEHDYDFYLCFLLNDKGYMETNLGTIFWKNFIEKCGIRYWYYIDEIGKNYK